MANSTIKLKKVGTIQVASETVSITAGARTSVQIDLSSYLPSGATPIAVNIKSSPNQNWLMMTPIIDGNSVVIYYHNEYNGTLSGRFVVNVAYAIN